MKTVPVKAVSEKTAPSRTFKISKLRFIANLVHESLLTRMQGRQYTPVHPQARELAVTWIGHSSFLLELAGRRILIDPVFSSFLIVLKRRRKPGIRLRDLPPIDLVLLSHAHMDHLNPRSLRAIVANNRRHQAQPPVVIVPKGVADLVEKLGFRDVQVLETWQTTSLPAEPTPLTITHTPARHWGARLFNDTWRGYGGYVVAQGAHSVYHAGDSASFAGFAEIGRRLQPTIAMLPIGAYYPDNFRSVHTSPEDALQAFQDLRSEVFIPMHYGTFRLSLEPIDEPPKRLLAAAAAAGIATKILNKILILEEGRTHVFPAAPELTNVSQP